MKIKKAIVTGANGPLGIKMVEKLSQVGVSVLAIIRPKGRRKAILDSFENVSVLEVDLEKEDTAVVDGWNDCDVCFHFAWIHTGDEGRNDPILQAKNINITLCMSQFAKEHGCKAFIGAGSQAEYGMLQGPANEETIENPTSLYGITKLAAGKLVMEYCKQNSIRCNWIRVFAVYGPYENDYIFTSYVIKTLLKGEKPILTPCEQIWDYLYVDDAIDAFIKVAEEVNDSGVYCIGSGNPKSIKEYVEIIRDSINPSLQLGIGEKAYPDNQIMHLEANCTKIHNVTGFTPKTSFEEGIKKTLDWYQTQY